MLCTCCTTAEGLYQDFQDRLSKKGSVFGPDLAIPTIPIANMTRTRCTSANAT